MTTAEQIEQVAHLNWEKRLGPPTLQWSEVEPVIPIANSLELDRALHKIAARIPPLRAIIATLYGFGSQVGIGLGLPLSFVTIHSCEPGQPLACAITMAEAPAAQDAEFYLLDKHRTQIRQRNLIPTTQARQIVREFMKTGSRPNIVQWEPL